MCKTTKNLFEFHQEMCEAVLFGLQTEAAVVGGKHFADEGKAKSLTVWLGGEERRKEFRGCLLRNGGPVVGDVN